MIRWLGELIGYGSTGWGTLTSGRSEANLLALKCARDRAGDGQVDGLAGTARLRVYASDQSHYSLSKSVDILGIGRANLVSVATDDRFRIRPDALVEAIERDLADGFRPCCVVGMAGTTSSGAVDPLDRIAEVATEYAFVVPRRRRLRRRTRLRDERP